VNELEFDDGCRRGFTSDVHNTHDSYFLFSPFLFGHVPHVPVSLLLLASTHSIMSLRPADSWITDLTPTLTSVSSAHSPSIASSTNTGSTAGRFAGLGSRMAQGSSGTGNEGEYNGGAKRAHLFLFDAVAQQGGSKICLGFVGQDNTRFCLRPANDQDPSTGTWFCGVQRHLIQFEPQDNTFYPRANEIIGFCSPSFPASLVPAQTLSEIKSER